jgi:DNA polymerase III psi subunit
MKNFEDFRDRVLKALDYWDQKALEISNLAQGYYTELDENRRLFVSMRQIIKDKDTLISNLQRTLKGKDHMITVATMETRKEMERYVANIK